jgi:hypothetical protein
MYAYYFMRQNGRIVGVSTHQLKTMRDVVVAAAAARLGY